MKKLKIIMSMLIVMLLVTGCTNYYEMPDYTYIREKAVAGESEIDASKIIAVDEFTYEIVYNATNEKRTEDKEFCTIVYHMHMKNISDRTINFGMRALIPSELTSSIIMSSTSFGLENKTNSLDIEPGHGYGIDAGIIMKHTDMLRSDEKKLFDSLADKLYLEFTIDGKKAYQVIDGQISK